jgi:predicted lipoprotein with Yx(FWY)xxD motif
MKAAPFLPVLILASATATAAFAAAPVKAVDSDKGKVLAGENGMTLYTFKNDKMGVSNCNDDCAKAWPPLMADADAKADGDYTVIKRKDGSMQWAKGGMPLYYFVKDKKAGDVSGEGMKGVWDAARP